MANNRPDFKCRNLTVTIDHNPYEVTFYNGKGRGGQVIIFPIFHFDGFKQYYDLIAPVLLEGYPVITINLLTKKDRFMFFNFYFKVFRNILRYLIAEKFVEKDDKLTLMGFGVGAYLVSNLPYYNEFNIQKLIMLSPVNQFKDEHQISDIVGDYKIPVYFHFGQNDNVTDLDETFKIFEKGKDNPFVHFSSYPVCGYYFYYKDILSLRLEETLRKKGFDAIVGESSKNRVSPLPEKSIVNPRFFAHLFNELEGKENKKRVGLFTDGTPIQVNGVNMVIELLQNELEKKGYEVYIVSLWNKEQPYKLLPNDTYIPVEATPASILNRKELQVLKTFNFAKHAKALALFGFDYLHLHTEYSMSKIALKLSKLTGIKMLYTYHTLWNLYYEHRFGKLIGDITYKAAKNLLFNQVYKDCDIITVPSKKSFEILKKDVKEDKDVRIIPSPINTSRFELSKPDMVVVKNLRKQYGLENKKVLGYVGRVSMEKNIFETLDYIARIKHEVPNIIFLIVGAGDAIGPLKKYIKRLKLQDYVTFVGEIDNSRLKYFYGLFDVFVTASNFETQGLTYFEAASCGTLILAKQDKAIEGIFVDGYNAYVYSDFYQWTEKLERALFGKNGNLIANAKKTLSQYSSDLWSNKILSIYKELNPKKE